MKAYRLNPGYSDNPLKKEHRNEICPCGSNKKFKVCCQPKMPPHIHTDCRERINCFDDLLNKYKEIVCYVNKLNENSQKNEATK